jgi:hypothetical protein
MPSLYLFGALLKRMRGLVLIRVVHPPSSEPSIRPHPSPIFALIRVAHPAAARCTLRARAWVRGWRRRTRCLELWWSAGPTGGGTTRSAPTPPYPPSSFHLALHLVRRLSCPFPTTSIPLHHSPHPLVTTPFPACFARLLLPKRGAAERAGRRPGGPRGGGGGRGGRVGQRAVAQDGRVKQLPGRSVRLRPGSHCSDSLRAGHGWRRQRNGKRSRHPKSHGECCSIK